MHAEQPDLGFVLAILTKEGADLAEDFGVELGAVIERVGAGDGGEIGVVQFQLDRAGMKRVFAEAAGYLFGKVRERGFETLRLQSEEVAEFNYRPHACQEEYRMVVVRKNISREKGEQRLFVIGQNRDLLQKLLRPECRQES